VSYSSSNVGVVKILTFASLPPEKIFPSLVAIIAEM
jgi:hypothetical protein